MDFPPYPCTGQEEVFNDVQILDADGSVVNTIVASACFADYYCHVFGGSWRRKEAESTTPPAPQYPGANMVDESEEAAP
jgi:hypothetical protein